MESNPKAITGSVSNLIAELGKLPGIGPKSAQRLAYYLLRASREEAEALADAITRIKTSTRLCSTCFNIADGEQCPVCSSATRQSSLICVVEQPQDILALEHIGVYQGVYHVLHGAIAPTEGMGAANIRIQELIKRLQSGDITEVIIATNPTTEGETTALYLQRIISPMGIRVTRLARGLPFGTELEYADDVTLCRALEGRQDF
ncbi:MAG: recombination mediator RecR [Dehalococcoidales bacterium]|nr:recombination mediator RecR [Dehalococcoidales bacterium]MDD3264788.1 recombination mediator RecR [Dehalococcoidales bacterium]MDD4322410.1 recombination mediator RecR [Dehalococcoidales bacterium]MDD4794122.1 recombination mediator RecR [Dehalococcoidales bacterium]MDD5122942.1 recombination mediator RecR [Dehalococcoidales bacterium]